MSSPAAEERLQVIAASTLLAQPGNLKLSGAVLITQVDSAEMAIALASALQTQFPSHYPISLLNDLTAAQPTCTDTSLGELGQQASHFYPLNIYLTATGSALLEALKALVQVVGQLRSPDGGCPWDLAQTPQSLIPYVIEEAYEVVDAIQSGDQHAIAEELGDLLLQVILQAQIASEQNAFTLTEIAQGITQKLIRRHPHVFGEAKLQTIDEVHRSWEQIKALERGQATPENQALSQKLSRYVRSLPPLMAGMKISQKAAAAGFEWNDIAGVWAKFYEELAEFQAALAEEDTAHQQAELGDLLFTVINLARWCQLDPSEALRSTNQRFIQRLAKMEASTDKSLSCYTLEELEARWQQAKLELKKNP
ncbi:MAG TPA: nucleoside triphosphate pyrophosphohydrolase [Candidatus Caenarcaniphilales bacterium]